MGCAASSSVLLRVIACGFVVRVCLVMYGEWQDAALPVAYTDVDYNVVVDGARCILEGGAIMGRAASPGGNAGTIFGVGAGADHDASGRSNCGEGDDVIAVPQGGRWIGSPYDRSTYRYTPLLAALVAPSLLVWRDYGKLVFCVLDCAIAWFLYHSVVLSSKGKKQKQKEEEKDTGKKGLTANKRNYQSHDGEKEVQKAAEFYGMVAACCWLFNPLSVNISTRGNSESVVCALVISALYFISSSRVVLGSVLYGTAVHFKIYPVLYAFPLLFHLGRNGGGTCQTKPKADNNLFMRAISCFPILNRFNARQWVFGITSFSVFLLLTLFCYTLYGWDFLYQTYLYHVTRTDHRHNLSIYFYYIYLTTVSSSTVTTGGFQRVIISLLGFVPQLAVLVAIVWRLSTRHINLCLFLMTLMFVTFNKVCTMQYYSWYLSLFPLLVPELSRGLTAILCRYKGHATVQSGLHRGMRNLGFGVLVVFAVWAIPQGFWLNYAYSLEFLGQPTFTALWLSSALFFAVNITTGALVIYVYSNSTHVNNFAPN
ncbi:GPI mannosyltransferase 1 [Pelomyxa schiedti]|nr:GPI mannosyltransferase 1 [Pelomyxa schiedti]